MALIIFQMKLCRIFKHNVVNLSIIAVYKMKQHRPTVLIREQFLVIVVQKHPPGITPTIYSAPSTYLDACAMPERKEVLVKFLHFR